MTFKEVLTQVIAWLQQDQRISYRALQRQFALDDDYLANLKDALLYAYPQVSDDGRGLVWTELSLSRFLSAMMRLSPHNTVTGGTTHGRCTIH
jgi:hypothetical protein